MNTNAADIARVHCAHCGAECRSAAIHSGNNVFCCNGCRLVFDLLQNSQGASCPSVNQASPVQHGKDLRFGFLDDEGIVQKIVDYQSKDEVHVRFRIPAMHCSSCVQILEQFRRIDPGVIRSRVNFPKKELSIIYDGTQTSLRSIAEALDGIGYPPLITFDSLNKEPQKKIHNKRILRIGVAGFCFGNIMLLSFPEYFSSGDIADASLARFFDLLILILALPVFLFSASEFFIRSYQSLKQKATSIDIPIAIGIAAIFLRSVYDIVTQTGPGYFDSGTGLVFFMLIGRWFQDYTFDALSFERDFSSYFPVAVTRFENGMEKSATIDALVAGDHILIHNGEIIPVDTVLVDGDAQIDYSFVTGESLPVHVQKGETVYAGGKQTGSLIRLEVTRNLGQSQLTQLWNQLSRHNAQSRFDKLVQAISRYFIVVTLAIATGAAMYWWRIDSEKAINAFTAVLVIACPCALALSAPFTYGNILRILGKQKIYLRNYQVMERLADITTIIFDKTGTLTEQGKSEVHFSGEPLSAEQRQALYSLVRQSGHPLSRRIAQSLQPQQSVEVEAFREFPGQGIEAKIVGEQVKAGTYRFVTGKERESRESTQVHVTFGNKYAGAFIFRNVYRPGLKGLADRLRKRFGLAVVSGDNQSEQKFLEQLFTSRSEFHFHQMPEDKLNFVKAKQANTEKVLMIGDGLNDAGALQYSDVGISLAEDTNSFTPASDIIMDASQLGKLDALLRYARSAWKIIIWSFVISLGYNAIGLSFAVSGTLSPMIAAILMPISTVSLVLFTVIASSLRARALGFTSR